VYSGGQVRTVRVTAVKASEVRGEAFFFDGAMPSRIRTMTLPRAGAMKVRPPAEFEYFLHDAQAKAEFEKTLKASLKASAEAWAPLKEQIKTEVLKKSIVRRSSII
jgi:hypothetical protein